MITAPARSNKDLYKRLAIRFVLAVLLGVFLIIFLPRIVGLTLPFVLALFVAMILNPLIRRINRRLLPSRRVTTLIITVVFAVSFSSLTVYLIYRLLQEIISLSVYIQQNWNSIQAQFEEFMISLEWIVTLLPEQVTQVIANFRANLISSLQDGVMRILSSTVAVGASIVSGVGSVVLGLLTFFLALYFAMADYDPMRILTQKIIGSRGMNSFAVIKGSIFKTFGGYMRAVLIFTLLAFIVMFTALSIYGQPYALLIALFLSIIDLLPLIGTIAILAPWGIFELIAGDPDKGIFLLLLGVGFFLLRRVLEPKIMGSQTGMHPLLTLFSVYVGLKFSGAWGALLGPIIMMLFLSIFRSGMLDNTIADVRAAAKELSSTLDHRSAETVSSEPYIVVHHNQVSEENGDQPDLV